MTRLGDSGSTSYFVSPSFSEVQISHVIAPGLEDDVTLPCERGEGEETNKRVTWELMS